MASAARVGVVAKGKAMTEPLVDGWPAFWFAPWRWAHADWRLRYGASAALFAGGTARQRLLLRGWIDTFQLGRQWAPPADLRWFEALAAPPAMMLDAAAVLGWIALVRAGGIKEASTPYERRLLCALRYRDVNCIDACLGPYGGAQWDATTCGLDLLLAMAEADWPDVAARVAMMRAPQPRPADASLIVRRLDAARCVTLWLAVLRWLRPPAGTGP